MRGSALGFAAEIPTFVRKKSKESMDPVTPRLPRNSVAADPESMGREEEITDAAFRGAEFMLLAREHLSVQGCLFGACLFAGSVLRNSRFTDVVFRNCDFSNADLRGCAFQRVEFKDCKLVGTNFSESTLQYVSFDRLKAEYVNFFGSRFRHVRLADVAMRNAVFDACRFERVEFSHCDLLSADFHGTRLKGISFADSDIRGIRVSEIISKELAGLKVNRLQAFELARFLGVEIEDE